MTMTKAKDLRVVFPLWMGGNNPLYFLGSQLNNLLAPEQKNAVTVHIPVAPLDIDRKIEDGIMNRTEIVKSLREGSRIIREYQPERIVNLGGDCLSELPAFSYLSEKYGDKFGILWIDAHPDIMSPKEFENSHAHALAALMGDGDSELIEGVKAPVPNEKVFIAGCPDVTDFEREYILKHKIRTATPNDMRRGFEALRAWIKDENIEFLAVHLDLDVLNWESFRSTYFAAPHHMGESHGIIMGEMEFEEVIAYMDEAGKLAQIVGFGVCEHLPWDAQNLKDGFAKFPLLKDEANTSKAI